MDKELSQVEKLKLCPVCNSDNIRLAYGKDICKFEVCKVYFRNPRPSEKSIIRCYDIGETFKQWQNELEIRNVLWQKRMDLVESYWNHGALLDIGTGDGYFLNFAAKNFNVVATEVSAKGIEYATSRGHNVHHGTIFDDKKFDVITMWHVLV